MVTSSKKTYPDPNNIRGNRRSKRLSNDILEYHLDLKSDSSLYETPSVHSRNALVLLLELDKLTLLMWDSYCKNYVYKTKAKYLREAIGNAFDDDEEFVIKIFVKDEIKAYNQEKTAVEILSQDPNFNNCYIPHRHGLARVFEDEKLRGPFLISKYIEDTDYFPNDKYQAIKKQVMVMYKNGIVQRSMKRDNMIYNAEEDKIYLIDFERVLFLNDINSYSHSWCLEDCLARSQQVNLEYCEQALKMNGGAKRLHYFGN